MRTDLITNGEGRRIELVGDIEAGLFEAANNFRTVIVDAANEIIAALSAETSRSP